MHSYGVWAEIDLSAIGYNLRQLRRVIASKARILVPVKANAYGHGLVPVAQAALGSGAEMLGVARHIEGVALREAGIDAPVLIFGYTPPNAARDLFTYALTPTVFSYPAAQAFSAAAAREKRKLKVHLKIETGMGRYGLVPTHFRPKTGTEAMDDVAEIESMVRLSGLEPEGIYTHFACSDAADKTGAERQFEHFMELLGRLFRRGIEFPIRHAANSAAVIDMPQTHLDMVRPGISVYGLYPSPEVDKNRVRLKPAMALKARIGQLKRVPADFKIGYGGTYTTRSSTVIATIPVGYADGYDRGHSSSGCMLVAGRRAPVIGRVCMDLTMLDVGHIPNVHTGAEVVIMGSQGNEVISADEIANRLGTINYEVVSTVMSRVPRIFSNRSRPL